jgi:hypothetical protein
MPKTAAEKLGVTPGSTLAVHNAPDGAVEALGLPDGATVAPPGVTVADVVLLFATDSAQLRRDFPAVLDSADDATRVWVAYRKGGVSDVGRDSLAPAFVDLGWHGVSLVAVDDRWSAVRFRRLDQIGRR